MARSSDELQRLVQSLVETFDAHLDVVRRDVAAQQEAMVHEVRSLHEATIRAMAELRAAVHRVELALHDQFAALEPTPAAGIARTHLGAPGAPAAAPVRAAAPAAALPNLTATSPAATTSRTVAADTALTKSPTDTDVAPTALPADDVAPASAPAPASGAVPTLPGRTAPRATSADTAPPAGDGVTAVSGGAEPRSADHHEPVPSAPPAAQGGLDVDRLVAMLESRLGEIDMTSGTSTD